MKVVYIPWSKALRLCYRLAEIIIDSGREFDVIVTISRGGLIPARIISDVLGIDELYTVRSRYWGTGGRIAPEPLIRVYEDMNISGKRVLIVDEVVDTGATMSKVTRLIRNLAPSEVATAVLHYKATSSFTPDYYAEKVDEWVWIFYPWSLSETLFELSRIKRGSDHVLDKAMRLIRELKVDTGLINLRHLSESLMLYSRRVK